MVAQSLSGLSTKYMKLTFDSSYLYTACFVISGTSLRMVIDLIPSYVFLSILFSLADAKMCEDVSEEFVCGDFAGDGA